MELFSSYAPSADGIKIGNEQFSVRDFTVRRGFEGPQVIISWTTPENTTLVDEIVIVRKLLDFPQNAGDGEEVFRGVPDTNSICDVDGLPDCDCVYYVAFSHRTDRDEFVSVSATRRSVLVFETGKFFGDLLFHITPEGWKLQSKNLLGDQAGTIQLDQRVDDDDEKYNLHEIVGKKKNPLERWIKILGTALDEAHQLIRSYDHQWDANTICLEHLDLLAHMIGLDITEFLPGLNQREEVKNHVALLKIKGTKRALAAKLRAITQLDVEVFDLNDFLIISPTIGQQAGGLFTLDPQNPSATSRLPIGFDFDTIWIVFNLDSSSRSLTTEMLRRIRRIIPDWLPACIAENALAGSDPDDPDDPGFQTTFDDITYVEEYDTEGIVDSHLTEIEQSPVTEDVWLMRRIISNDVQKVSNDFLCRSMGFGEILEDNFWDQRELQFFDTEQVFGYNHIISNDIERLSNSNKVTIDIDPILTVRDFSYDILERDVDVDTYLPFGYLLYANDEDSLSNSKAHLTPAPQLYCDSWWDDITVIPVTPALVSTYSNAVSVEIPDAPLVSSYSDPVEANLNTTLFSSYSDGEDATPNP